MPRPVANSLHRACLVLTLLASGAALACSRAEAAPTPPAPATVAVKLADAVERAVPKTLTVTGTLLANRESDVAADVAGRVVHTDIERGSFVQKGALLARLDARSAVLGRSEASAQVSANRVQKDTAELECQRAERLFQANAISRAELDRVRATCRSSDFSTAAAFARQQMAEKAITDAHVRAPFAGMVAERDVSVGEYVAVGKRIATIVELDPLRLELTVPEAASASIAQGSSVDFEVESFPGERFPAVVRYIGPVLRRSTRDLIVEAVVDNAAGRLRPGMFAEARLRVGERRLPVIPASALLGTQPSQRVFVVQKGIAEERVVLASEADAGNVAILSGVRPGERVVAAPPAGLTDGARVR